MTQGVIHLGRRYHGPTSQVYRDAVERVPPDQQLFPHCGVCRHTIFVEHAAFVKTQKLGASLLCLDCLLDSDPEKREKALAAGIGDQLEPCPTECIYA